MSPAPSGHPRLPVSPSSPWLGLLCLFSCGSCLALGLGMDPEPLEDTLAQLVSDKTASPQLVAGPPVQASVYSTCEEGGSGLM